MIKDSIKIIKFSFRVLYKYLINLFKNNNYIKKFNLCKHVIVFLIKN